MLTWKVLVSSTFSTFKHVCFVSSFGAVLVGESIPPQQHTSCCSQFRVVTTLPACSMITPDFVKDPYSTACKWFWAFLRSDLN